MKGPELVAALATGVAAGVLFPYDHIILSGMVTLLGSIMAYLLLKGTESRFPWYFAVLFLAGACRGLAWKIAGGTGLEPQDMQLVVKAREALYGAIDSAGFGESSAPLVKALLSGDRSDIPSGLREAFRNSGASHILALSGMHLGIIYAILSKCMSIAGGHPVVVRLRAAVIVTCCLIYAVVTGASPSIMRAFLFILLREIAVVSCRSREPLTIFSSAMMIQLLLSPGNILTPGFQLSYLAMAGIYILFPWLSSFYPPGPKDPLKKVWDIATLSISCQAFTAPVAWYHFHSFPQWFLLTNMIAMPLASLLIPVSLSVIVLSQIGACPVFLSRFADLLAQLMSSALTIISTL
ncbi:MAG: ComEC/Rec2 family competence protein [Bacteroidales bacterium]|nr:ComEC/Rec2 family competence protein [Candidatus Cryptobacteroides caccocaballi]